MDRGPFFVRPLPRKRNGEINALANYAGDLYRGGGSSGTSREPLLNVPPTLPDLGIDKKTSSLAQRSVNASPSHRPIVRRGAMIANVRRAASGRSWLTFVVAVSTALLPICVLACAGPVAGAPDGPHQQVRQMAECAADAGSGPEHGSEPNAPANPCRHSHNNGVKIDSLTAKSSHGAWTVVFVGHSIAPQPASAPIATKPSVASVSLFVSPLAITLRI